MLGKAGKKTHEGKATGRFGGMNVVKRISLVLALVATLALASVAVAATPTLRGKLDGGGHVAFELKKNDRGQRKVIDWRWRNLPLRCGENTHKHDGHFVKPGMLVDSKRHFGDERENVDPQFPNSAIVDGTLSPKWRRARGTLKVSGTFTWGECDSGVVNWTAKRK
jgi:hypothetical protein